MSVPTTATGNPPLVQDAWTLDCGTFVAPRYGHPARHADEIGDDWKNLRKEWAIPTREGTCWGESGNEHGEWSRAACGNCRCFTIVSWKEAKNNPAREPVWVLR